MADSDKARFASTLTILWPYWRSPSRGAGFALAGLVLAAGLAASFTTLFVNRALGTFMGTLQALQEAPFRTAALIYVAALCCQALFNILQVAFQNVLVQHWRRWLTYHLIGRWLDGYAYYRIERGGLGDNPDQRIQEDVLNALTDTVSLTIGTVIQFASLGTYIYLTWTGGGALDIKVGGWSLHVPGYLVWSAIMAAVLEIALTQIIGRNYVDISVRRERVTADFRYDLVQVRDHAEQIGFYCGEPVEERRLHHRFGAVWRAELKLIWLTFRLSVVGRMFGSLYMVVPLALLSPRMFDRSIGFGDAIATASAWTGLVVVLTFYAGVFTQIGRWRGSLRRLATFTRAIDAFDPGAIRRARNDEPQLWTHDLNLALPSGEPLTHVGNLMVAPAERVLIQGPSGSGKSTLLRALAGLWNHGDGTVAMPPPDATLFLPQRPYLPDGKLREILSYPGLAERFDTSTLVQALERCGLPQLAIRLDESDRWRMRLSLGEQQRLGFARILLQRPAFVFLDEATSAMDPAAEADLYAMLLKELPGTAIVSVAHRPQLAQFHDRVITVGRDAVPG